MADLEEIYEDFVAAMVARDAASEDLNEAYKALKSANLKYDHALEALAELLGSEGGLSERSDIEDILGIPNSKNVGDLFGDLF